jgi:peptidoglycan/xylan/chitin deacetylase (PgdA/CDA1 family)
MIRLLLIALLLAPFAFGREVAVTFDDVPDVDDDLHSAARQAFITNLLVSRLRAERVPAIGFVNEDKLDDGTLLETWHHAGLELGNHTYAHTELDTAGAGEFTCDIGRGDAITTRVLGHSPIWFRHPYLETGKTPEQRDAVNAFLAEHGYETAPVTIDDSDWIFDTAYDVATWWRRPFIRRAYINYMQQRFEWAEYESRLVFGRDVPQVLLLHASALNADTFPALAQMIRARGYTFITLADAVSDSAYASKDEWLAGGVGWIERWGVTAGMNEAVFESDPQVPAWIQTIAKQREDQD